MSIAVFAIIKKFIQYGAKNLIGLNTALYQIIWIPASEIDYEPDLPNVWPPLFVMLPMSVDHPFLIEGKNFMLLKLTSELSHRNTSCDSCLLKC